MKILDKWIKEGHIMVEGTPAETLKLSRTIWGKSGEKYSEKEMKAMGFIKNKPKKFSEMMDKLPIDIRVVRRWKKLKGKPKTAVYQGLDERGSLHWNPKTGQYYLYTHSNMPTESGLKGSSWYKLKRMV
jgi:hypothetical protein